MVPSAAPARNFQAVGLLISWVQCRAQSKLCHAVRQQQASKKTCAHREPSNLTLFKIPSNNIYILPKMVFEVVARTIIGCSQDIAE